MQSLEVFLVVSWNKLLNKQSRLSRFETQWHSCDITVMSLAIIISDHLLHARSMGYCKKDVTPLLTHWSYVCFALTHRDDVIQNDQKGHDTSSNTLDVKNFIVLHILNEFFFLSALHTTVWWSSWSPSQTLLQPPWHPSGTHKFQSGK